MKRDPYVQVEHSGNVTLIQDDPSTLTLGDLEDLVAAARREGHTSRSPVATRYNASYLREEIIVRRSE